MMARVGLIGDPVAHSVSPAMHNAAFAYHGLHEIYALWLTPAAELGARVGALRAEGMIGANVTIPHKTAVVPLLDVIDPVVDGVGAANTIVRGVDGRLRGLNTDVGGFLRALATTGFDPRDRAVVMFGAGGAARGVGYGLIRAGVRSLVVANRTVERAEALLADLLATSEAEPFLLAIDPQHDDVRAAIAEADLLVNATSIGLDGATLPIAPELIGPDMLVVDLIYHTTPFLRAAAARGAQTQDGLEMLVQQGALAFEAWTDLQAPVAEMRAAAQQALKERT